MSPTIEIDWNSPAVTRILAYYPACKPTREEMYETPIEPVEPDPKRDIGPAAGVAVWIVTAGAIALYGAILLWSRIVDGHEGASPAILLAPQSMLLVCIGSVGTAVIMVWGFVVLVRWALRRLKHLERAPQRLDA